MAKKNLIFAIFTLILTLSLVVAHYEVHEFFSPASEYLAKLQKTEAELERQKLRTALAQSEIEDYQVVVAAHLPSNTGLTQEGYQVRNIASVSQATLKEIDTSSVVMEKIREEFRQKKYSAVVSNARQFLQSNFSSPHVVEAYFLKGEASYVQGDYAGTLDVAEKMMELFPESELTGYMILRMSVIFKNRERSVEAAELLRIVQRSFSQYSDLTLQASRLAKTYASGEKHDDRK